MKFIVSVLLLFISCIKSQSQIYNTKHFKIFYTNIDRNTSEVADSLETNYGRIITTLHSQQLPTVSVHLYIDTISFREGIKRWVPNPSIWTTGITLGDSAIHIISPNASNQDYKAMIKSIIHEFAHCVSRHINWTLVNNPRWLWEAIAIYEANQTSDPYQLSYLINQKPPTLKQLNDWSDTTLYDVGYFIGEYLVSKGDAVLNSLIKNDGNIKQTLDMDDEEFTKQWFAFVRKKYGIKKLN